MEMLSIKADWSATPKKQPQASPNPHAGLGFKIHRFAGLRGEGFAEAI
jgi:hypothetical protein